ncbi:NAD(P)-dependent oxidoreductase [Nocardia araoensis]|uniref:NAD(P)-dependent oxidoreductase n=1 Tax=Nocardia araoensis TaxID=228600 RepID=UPI0002FB48E5|nr:NAD(P)-dependent oxidoreductase [Nocardia araoensis]
MSGRSSRCRVLLTGADLSSADSEWLRQQNLEVEVRRYDLSEIELARALVDKDAYILGGVERVTAAALSTAENLKVIAFMGVGYHAYIDTAAASAAGIAVTNAPGANARAVAEFAIGLMLDAWRAITDLAMETRAGRWRETKGRNLHAKTLGIVGMGTIGTMVARIAANGFGMRVVYVSRTAKPELERDIAARRVFRTFWRREEIHALSTPASVIMPGGCPCVRAAPVDDGESVGTETDRCFLDRLGYPVGVLRRLSSWYPDGGAA